jgi:hypothetical protein
MSWTSVTTDPTRCPFCGDDLSSPGEGFVRHVEASADCHEQYERWRMRVAEDIRGVWAG